MIVDICLSLSHMKMCQKFYLKSTGRKWCIKEHSHGPAKFNPKFQTLNIFHNFILLIPFLFINKSNSMYFTFLFVIDHLMTKIELSKSNRLPNNQVNQSQSIWAPNRVAHSISTTLHYS